MADHESRRRRNDSSLAGVPARAVDDRGECCVDCRFHVLMDGGQLVVTERRQIAVVEPDYRKSSWNVNASACEHCEQTRCALVTAAHHGRGKVCTQEELSSGGRAVLLTEPREDDINFSSKTFRVHGKPVRLGAALSNAAVTTTDVRDSAMSELAEMCDGGSQPSYFVDVDVVDERCIGPLAEQHNRDEPACFLERLDVRLRVEHDKRFNPLRDELADYLVHPTVVTCRAESETEALRRCTGVQALNEANLEGVAHREDGADQASSTLS